MIKLIALVALALAAQACSVATDGPTDTADFSEAATTGKDAKPPTGKDRKPCQLAPHDSGECGADLHVCSVPTVPTEDGSNVTNDSHHAAVCVALDPSGLRFCCLGAL